MMSTGVRVGRRFTWIELLKTDKRAFFTACNKASKAADYL
jgi:antirestriction protein ArdC